MGGKGQARSYPVNTPNVLAEMVMASRRCPCLAVSQESTRDKEMANRDPRYPFIQDKIFDEMTRYRSVSCV